MPLKSSQIDLGPVVGTLCVLQMDEASFYSNCLQKNSTRDDSTGSRVYTACHVLCRFVAMRPELFKNKRVMEIGCGVGIASIAACISTELAHVVLTDGNAACVAIARQNLQHAGFCAPPSPETGGSSSSSDSSSSDSSSSDSSSSGSSCSDSSISYSARASAQTYSWGDPPPEVPGDIPGGGGGCFDVLLGSELCYYNTDMALLVDTAQRLLTCAGKEEAEEGGGGIFVHAHIFRKAGQEEDMIRCFRDMGWDTAEVSVTAVVGAEELREQSGWLKVRCLVSGPRAVIAALMAADPPLYCTFRPQNPLDDEGGDSDEEAFGLGSLFS